MSELKVNKVSPRSGTDVTLGDSGDTFTIPAGATITNSGTANGFGEAIPSGVILMWHGTSGNIPSGWVICDGNNSTPNLTDKFIKASGTANNTGGSSTSGATTLSESQIPSHKHNLNGNNANIAATNSSWATLQSSTNTVSSPNPIQNTGGGGSHTHSVEPPYYTLIFIMKT